MSYLGLTPPPYACEATVEELSFALERAQEVIAARTMDLSALYATIAQAERAFVCADAAIPPALIGDLYELEAVARYLTRDSANAERLVHAAVIAADGVRPAVSARYPELGAFQGRAQGQVAAPGVALLMPTGLVARVDGVEALTRPNDRPYALQLLDAADGRALWTGLIPTGAAPDLDALLAQRNLQAALAQSRSAEEALAAHLAAAALAQPAEPPPDSLPAPGPPPSVSPRWVGLALGTTALATGLHAGAALGYRGYLESVSPTEGDDPRRVGVNTTQAVAIGVGAVAVALDLGLIWRLTQDARSQEAPATPSP